MSFASFSSTITSFLSYSFRFSSYFFVTIALLALVYNRTMQHSVGPRDRLPRHLGTILLDKNVKGRNPRLLLAPLPRGLRRVGSSLVLGPSCSRRPLAGCR